VNNFMEKEVKMKGEEYNKKCKACPGQMAYNRSVTAKADSVTVTCRFDKCIKEE